jgi:tRNA modification GTPase
VLLAYENETIAAISTPAGEGGISVVRVTGANAISVVAKGFHGSQPLDKMSSHTAQYGRFVNEAGAAIDNVLVLVFRGPNSYTGEDTVEINCHGGRLLTKIVLEATIRFGARPAQPGEFTKRAFLNGRMDLAQAEAVADLIHARSERAHQASLVQLNGRLSQEIASIRKELIESISLLELELDFAEDGYEFKERTEREIALSESLDKIRNLISTHRVGRVYRDGVKVVLAGAPNVGKSSLLNALLQEDRAIVTDVPGTTRDIIEESITLDGILFDLSDTAGLRESGDPVEQEGVRRAEERLSDCEIVVLLLDRTRVLEEGEATAIRRLAESAESRAASCIVVVNKADLPANPGLSMSGLERVISKHQFLEVSAKTHMGLDSLKQSFVASALRGASTKHEGDVTITNERHFEALERAYNSVAIALETMRSGESGEFVAVDLRAALGALGEIVGVTTTEDILNSIFARFCIGK